jgi:antitoxin (DNA-binding transcriptional repressor) of toxin-antitoxin stability system
MVKIMAKTVGVGELKRNAPRLVEAASKGERIIVSRYGRPRAQLVAIAADPNGEKPASPRMAAWMGERDAYHALPAKTRARYRGRYVAVAGGRVVDSDPDHEALYRRVSRKYPERAVFIGPADGFEPIVEMPGFEVL